MVGLATTFVECSLRLPAIYLVAEITHKALGCSSSYALDLECRGELKAIWLHGGHLTRCREGLNWQITRL